VSYILVSQISGFPCWCRTIVA